ncbi:hypothetical protein niasHT_021954 [Heterodera trifolii]|uniref:Uncharacterized protein n=1 Tax=Heterodera trifolii TaxID=157864 RepID=A0ABD2K014_9BILA
MLFFFCPSPSTNAVRLTATDEIGPPTARGTDGRTNSPNSVQNEGPKADRPTGDDDERQANPPLFASHSPPTLLPAHYFPPSPVRFLVVDKLQQPMEEGFAVICEF